MIQFSILIKPISIVVVLFSTMSFSQDKKHAIEWAEEQQKTIPKNMVIFIHTDWCRYCKAMQNTTFANVKVQELLKANFYFTELDGEEKENITFADIVFHYRPTGLKTGFHELAAALATIEGRISYPTIVILNPNKEIIFQYNGFMTASEFLGVLTEIHH